MVSAEGMVIAEATDLSGSGTSVKLRALSREMNTLSPA
jgi:hypothetical protein